MSVRRWRRSPEGGFTLAEMMVALTLITVGLIATLAVFASSAHSQATERNHQYALRLASQQIESLRAAPFSSIASSTSTQQGMGRTFTVVTTVTTLDAASNGAATTGPVVKRADVSVSWILGGSHTVSLTTEIADTSPGIYAGTAVPTPSGSPSGGPQVTSFALVPSPLVVTSAGVTTQSLTASAQLTGYPASTILQASWTLPNTSAGTIAMTSTDGQLWTGTLSSGSVFQVPGISVNVSLLSPTSQVLTTATVQTTTGLGTPTPTPSATPSASVSATSSASASATPTPTPSPTASLSPLSFQTTTVSPTSIVTEQNNKNSAKGKNSASVTFDCTVSGINPQTLASGTLTYLTPSGSASINLVHDTGNSAHFSVTFPQYSTTFSQGSAEPFVFAVTQGSQTIQKTIYVSVT
ncbi:MAG TPA: prepilin-type N-terminal cleavage/methylation domain-containing protein [Mycobacteriales bacterium]|nr:prepilin-type N-terminal cleavage/methylation domain-containing protein [Mycobacteriales bacterium]